MKLKKPLESDLIFEQAKAAVNDIISLRPMEDTDKSSCMPVFFSPSPFHDVDPMKFKIGELTDTPWAGVKCMGISLSEHEVIVVCEVIKPIRFDAHQHGPWEEKLVMETGVLYEHRSGEVFRPGEGIYHQMPGKVHEPEFLTPSRCVITWTRQPGRNA